MIPTFSQIDAEVLLNSEVADGLYVMRLRAPCVAESCRPAQFVQVQTDPGLSPFLRRPFSALRVDREAGWFEILYDVIGKGTRRMAQTEPGHVLGLVGPLGVPFSPPESDRLLLVAGGVGLVPLAFLAWEEPERLGRMTFLMGAAHKNRMPNLAALLPDALPIHAATDDGSSGHHGFITDLIPEHAAPGTLVFTCGPHKMMARVADICAGFGLPCYASLENHMACGFGACVGCVVEYREADRED